ncbi:TonB family protein [Sphingobacterium sp. UT-1RO-CII-1]|uniref:energy transducer TonB n=1 Tax=Sphingobacterium sp. UT-1RO-CII-1 TaxID=2995225 RepID=UPI00227D1167|nr:energy transducer TonB [Sphingobacterium sp. UT-1RO-CII-1]MCY4780843.1 TonB family protein [Sphingobacterium sp. UT-1RO-CII-1]
MFGSKLDIFKKEWLDVVFANRNREYGAYDLRKFAPKATNTGLVLVASAVFLFSAPKVFNIKVFPDKPIEEAPVITEVTLEDLEIPEPEKEEEEPLPIEEPPQRIAQDPPAEDVVRFPEPKVVPQNQVTEEIASQEEFKEKASPARITLKGTGKATSIASGEIGPKKVEGQITGSLTGDPDGNADLDKVFNSVEIPPDPVGGINAFRTWVQNQYQYPQGAIDAGVKGQIVVSFVVERDGSLTDIKIVKDLSYGTGQALVNVLKKAKPWKPGVQNGRKVRVNYQLPMTLNLQQ